MVENAAGELIICKPLSIRGEAWDIRKERGSIHGSFIFSEDRAKAPG
jgi:hypothetical protein